MHVEKCVRIATRLTMYDDDGNIIGRINEDSVENTELEMSAEEWLNLLPNEERKDFVIENAKYLSDDIVLSVIKYN